MTPESGALYLLLGAFIFAAGALCYHGLMHLLTQEHRAERRALVDQLVRMEYELRQWQAGAMSVPDEEL